MTTAGASSGDLVPAGEGTGHAAPVLALPTEAALAVQEKVQEYGLLVAPVERALRELQLTRGMLRARIEEEIHGVSPALAALSETLGISTLDLLTAADRAQFLRDAVSAARVPVEEVRRRLVEAGAGSGEQLKALGLPEAA
jgi:hypothetical protein